MSQDCINTTSSQDRTVREAEELSEALQTLNPTSICTLIETIRDLDQQITKWKICSECGSPEELRGKMDDLKSEIRNAEMNAEEFG